MTEHHTLQLRFAALKRRNDELVQRATNAEQVMAAFARGEVDAVMLDPSATPVLLRAAQEKLRSSQKLLRAIFDGAPEPMVLTDGDGTYVDANPAACALYALPLTQLVGRKMSEFAGGAQEFDTANRGFRERGEIRGTVALQRADGTLRVVESSWVANVADGLNLSVMRDTTDRVAAERSVQQSHRQLEEAQAIAHVGSWTLGLLTDPTIRMSREGARIFGASEGMPLTLSSFLESVHPDDRELFRRAIHDAATQGDVTNIEHRIQRAGGRVRWVHERGVVERDEAKQPVRMVGTVQDVTDHRLAVEALRSSEEEFRLLAEAMPQIVWIMRPDGSNVYFNQQWVDYTGLSLEESRGHGWSAPFHPDDQQRAAQAWQAATTAGTYALECRLRRADGVYRWWLIRGVPVQDARGATAKWFGTCTDIDTLKQGQERLRVLHDVAEAMLGQVDPLQVVPAALRVLGQHLRASRCAYAIIDADGEHCDVVHEYADGCVGMVGRHRLSDLGAPLVRGPSVGGETIVMRDVETTLGRDSPYWAAGVRAFVCSSLVAHGAPRALMIVHHARSWGWTVGEIAIIQEVLDRSWIALEKSAAAAKLRENEALVRIAGRAARLGGWSVTLPDFRLTWSDEVCRIHEVAPGTALGLEEAVAYYAPEFREAIRANIAACLEDGTPFDAELQIVTATGRRIWVRALGNAERDFSGAITTLRGAFQDIDERRKLQEQFRQAQKMEAVGRLAGGIAHDFNNVLSVVLSYAELALASLKSGDPLRRDIEQIESAGQRATGLTRQLLAFSRQQVLEPRVIDLSETIDAMKPMLSRLLGEDVDVAVLTPEHIGRVLADPSQIEQVVMNLAVNARDAMPEGGKLVIALSNVSVEEAHVDGQQTQTPHGVFVLLAMTDSGMGMTEATLARAFEPFFTTKEPGKGTGLGLATVFGIVQQSGGFVTVDSTLNQGTTFKIYLPRTDRVAEAPLANTATSVLGGSETILLVEDEEQVRGVACTILRRHGYVVLEACNGGEAYLLASDFSGVIDLLLTDVIMPRVSGRKLADQLTALRPDMKVLFASGYTDDEILRHGVLDADVAFLQKPFTPKALLKKVRDALERTGARRDSQHAQRGP